MAKEKKAIITIISVFGLAIVLYFSSSLFAYEKAEQFYDFPVPKFAKITDQKETLVTYRWMSTSESKKDGIPLAYRVRLKMDGWVIKEREGFSAVYQKGQHEVNVIAEPNYLSVFITPPTTSENK